jgi:hypothetical protein
MRVRFRIKNMRSIAKPASGFQGFISLRID